VRDNRWYLFPKEKASSISVAGYGRVIGLSASLAGSRALVTALILPPVLLLESD
jgi:hypothetical protein